MPNAVAVRFRFTSTDCLVDSGDVAVQEGDHVVVRTDKGREVALANGDTYEATDEEFRASEHSTVTVLRIASQDDLDRADELARKSREALPVFRELIVKHDLDMKPIRVEYLFDSDKAVFYFASAERVDFRDLVRELASALHTRVDMRQIGVRDEARIVGGLSHCGQELCCARMGGEFQPVSIRMAKEQDLPLNPLKISGLCGRLMCCLRYEFEAYKDFKGRAPKKGATIETPIGLAKVVDFDTPREIISLRFEDGQSVKIPLAEMGCSKECKAGDPPVRPDTVSAEVIEEHLHGNSQLEVALSGVERSLEDGVVENDVEGRVGRSPRRRSRGGSGNGNGQGASQDRTSKGRGSQSRGGTQGRGGSASDEHGDGSKGASGDGQRKPRRRRRSGSGSSSSGEQGQQQDASTSTSQRRSPQSRAPQSRSSQNHSEQNHSEHRRSGQGDRPRPGRNSSGIRAQSGSGDDAQTQRDTDRSAQTPRRQPRRRHPAGNGSGNSAGSNGNGAEGNGNGNSASSSSGSGADA